MKDLEPIIVLSDNSCESAGYVSLFLVTQEAMDADLLVGGDFDYILSDDAYEGDVSMHTPEDAIKFKIPLEDMFKCFLEHNTDLSKYKFTNKVTG